MNKINGQTSIFLLDLKGNEYPAIAEVNRKKRVNGQREITLSFLYEDINADFIHDIEFGWKILFKGEWYTIINPTYALDGGRFSVGVEAVLSFFVDMNGHFLQDEVTDKSVTPGTYFTELFKGTGYSYVLVDNLLANTLNYQANQSKTERFLYGIDRFNGEYVIRGKVAYIHGLIGSDKDVILREDLNIQDVSIEVNGSGFHTWAKGFGDKDESEMDADYKLEVEYLSPLIAKYGKIEGPAIRDGSFKHGPALIEAAKKQVENSAPTSTTITAVDLTNNGYPEMQFDEGDRVWVHVTQLKQNQQVRVVEIDETFDWEGEIIDAQYTVGNEGIAARYKSQQYNTLSDFRDIASGFKELEFSWLPEAIKRAADIINGNLDSHFHYGAGEIIGINKSNPNGYMRFNTDGLGFSRDGGKTYGQAITYEGVVVEALTAGRINANNVSIGNNKVLLDNNGVFVYKNSILGASLVEGNLSFNDQSNGQRIGLFAATLWSDGITKGISMNMEANRYVSFGHYTGAGTGYTPMVVMNPGTAMAGVPRGLVVNLPYRANDDIWVGPNALRFGLNNNHNHASIYKSSGEDLIVASYQSVGLAHITSGGVANTKLSIHPNEVKINVDTTFHGLNIRSYSDLWMGAKTLRFGDNPNHNHATVGLTSGRDLRLASYSGIGLAHITSGGVYQTKFSVDSNVNHSWQDLDMHGWRILRAASLEAESFVSVSDSSTFVGKSSSLMTRPEENEATDYIKNLDLARYTDDAQPKFLALNSDPAEINVEHSTDLNEVLMYVVKSIQEIDDRLNKKEGVA